MHYKDYKSNTAFKSVQFIQSTAGELSHPALALVLLTLTLLFLCLLGVYSSWYIFTQVFLVS